MLLFFPVRCSIMEYVAWLCRIEGLGLIIAARRIISGWVMSDIPMRVGD